MCSLIFFRIMDAGFISLMAGYCILVHPECTCTLTEVIMRQLSIKVKSEKFRSARINHTKKN